MLLRRENKVGTVVRLMTQQMVGGTYVPLYSIGVIHHRGEEPDFPFIYWPALDTVLNVHASELTVMRTPGL